ncbi:MAG: hypothetical protein ABI970_10110, partial [Chloroflexota bacterium]
LKAYAPTWGCDGSTLVVNVGTGDTSNIYVLDKLLPQSSPINTTDQLVMLSNSPSGKLYDPFIAPDGQAWEQTAP